MRLFFGLPVAEGVREQVACIQERLRRVAEKVTWVPPANLHFTLRFLGEVPESEVEATADAAEGAWRATPPGRIVLRGVGAFPNPRSPRVLWIGIAEGAGLVGRLQEALSEALLAAFGWAKEERDFVPHLTIARIRMPRRDRALEEAIAELSAVEVGAFEAGSFALYQSLLRPSGSIYRAVRTYSPPTA